MAASTLNCRFCNRSFKWHNTLQRHEQLDCPKRSQLPVGTKIRTTTDGASGVVVRLVSPYGNLGYRVRWDAPRFGQVESTVGPRVVETL